MNIFPQARETLEKISEWNHIKVKYFCITKETNNKIKIQPIKLEKIFKNDTLDKVLIFKYIRNSYGITPKPQAAKSKINKWEYIQPRRVS